MIPTSFTMTPIRDHFQESAQLAQTILGDDAFMEAMDRAGQTFIESLAGGHKILPAAMEARCATPCTLPRNSAGATEKTETLRGRGALGPLGHDVHRERLRL